MKRLAVCDSFSFGWKDPSMELGLIVLNATGLVVLANLGLVIRLPFLFYGITKQKMDSTSLVILVAAVLNLIDEEMAINEQAMIIVMAMRRHKLHALRKFMAKLQERRRRVYQPLRGWNI